MKCTRPTLTSLLAAGSLLAAFSPVASADEPVVEWLHDDKGGSNGEVDSMGNFLVGYGTQTTKYAPDGTKVWEVDFDIAGGHTVLNWLAVDSQDNVIRGGYQESGDGGYLAVKFDPDGNELWHTVFAPGASTQAIRVAVDELGGVYLFGQAFDWKTSYRFSTVKLSPDGQVEWDFWGFGSGPKAMIVRDGQVVVAGSGGGGDFVAESYSYDGTLNWTNAFQPGSSGTFDLAVGDEGQVVVCGWGQSSIGSAGTVVQYDKFGNEQWVANYNGPVGIEIFRRVAIDSQGAVIAVGTGLTSEPDDAWSIVKFDASGAFLWSRLYDNVPYGQSGGFEDARAVAIGPADSIYVGGSSDQEVSCGGYGWMEGQVVKYSADGDLQWHHHLPCYSGPHRIYVDESAGLHVLSLYQVFRLRERIGSTYCSPAVVNSTGLPAEMLVTGSSGVGYNEITLTANDLPADQFGYFLVSETQGFVATPPGSIGNLCLAGAIGRFAKDVAATGAIGQLNLPIDLANLPSGLGAIQPGETWNFQAWFRDGLTSNFTDGVGVPFE